MYNAARIAIVGDFNPEYDTHHATNAALTHSAAALGAAIDAKWVATSCLPRGADRILRNYDGLWIAPGSPYRSMDGAFEAIRFGRTQSWPLIGT
jgi:CTP synthase (UTP-ammonia lyase)